MKKLFTTLGPATKCKEVLSKLNERNVAYVRLNLSHTPIEKIKSELEYYKDHLNIPIVIDTEGSQVRTGTLEANSITLNTGDKVRVYENQVNCSKKELYLRPPEAVRQLEVGNLIFIDFDTALLKVDDVSTLNKDKYVTCSVINGGVIGNNKAVTLPEQKTDLPPLSTKDILAIEIAREMGINIVNLSFADTIKDIESILKINPNAHIISKIETKKGLINLPEILKASNAIIIDRGDLSREISIEKISFIQKKIIAMAKEANTEVFVATNFLDTMMKSKKPSRAEVNDIINTLLDGADGLVLAAETAVENYPIENLEPPKISIITVSFNQGKYIRDNIESVLAQNYSNFEHIIIDAGSTDETLEILKEYPHLNWVSEPDRGQSHGLNKGFSKASGEIIAWLNSDDFLAPNIFHKIAQELESYPIVMGVCQFIDDQNQEVRLAENLEHNLFDILKYWVNDSSPAQPSIFFRKSLLGSVKLNQSDYLDEDLHYAMDYDLWLRISRKKELIKRIPDVCSYFRTHPETKTGGNQIEAQNEVIRIFKKHENLIVQPEAEISFIIPANKFSEDLTETLKSISAQKLKNWEIIFADYAINKNIELQNYIKEIKKLNPTINIRCFTCQKKDLINAIFEGMEFAASKIISWLNPGDIIDQDFALHCLNIFSMNTIGIAFPAMIPTEHTEHIDNKNEMPIERFNSNTIFEPKYSVTNFVIRKLAFLDCKNYFNDKIKINKEISGYRGLLLWMIYKGWQIGVYDNLSLTPKQYNALINLDNQKIENDNINLIAQIVADYDQNPFAKVRAEQGLSFTLNLETRENARKYREAYLNHLAN